MKNLKSLSALELRSINGGNNYYDDGNGGDRPNPGPIVFKPTTGPTFPDPDTILW